MYVEVFQEVILEKIMGLKYLLFLHQNSTFCEQESLLQTVAKTSKDPYP